MPKHELYAFLAEMVADGEQRQAYTVLTPSSRNPQRVMETYHAFQLHDDPSAYRASLVFSNQPLLAGYLLPMSLPWYSA